MVADFWHSPPPELSGLLVSPIANSVHQAYWPSDCFEDSWLERAASIIQISDSEDICRRGGAIRTEPGRQEALVEAKLTGSSILVTGWVTSS
jgi:hypothetical protein